MSSEETPPFDDLPRGALRVLQVTDTHLYADPDGCLLGLNTRHSLDQVLDLTRRRHPCADLVLATGDLVHDASPAGYARLQRMLTSLGVPVYCIPGNHDDPGPMRRHLLGGGVRMVFQATHGGWSLVFLDSTVPGEDGGMLRPDELEQLEGALAAAPDLPTLVCLHHHPFPVGSSWIDSMALGNAADLEEVLGRHPQVRAVLFGHVHQEVDNCRNGVRYLASPSTCIQFAPGTDRFGLDPSPPGYRWLGLLPGGGLRTGVLRLDSMPASVELDSAGY